MPDAAPKNWYRIEAWVTRRVEEAARSLLFDLGTSGILTARERADDVALGAYFELDPETADRIVGLIEAEFTRMGHRSDLLRLDSFEVPDEDWLRKWKEGFEQVDIGSRLTVCPSWKRPAPQRARRTVLKIDPGMAFGTGTHETTRMALEEIERNWRGGSFLDVGTGSGILAIAAALLAPASRVVAIDLDPVAVGVARENAEANGVAERVEVCQGMARDFVGRQFDMLAANLTAESIFAELPDFVACTAPSASIILSGVLTELADDVERAGRNGGLIPAERVESAEWTAFLMRHG